MSPLGEKGKGVPLAELRFLKSVKSYEKEKPTGMFLMQRARERFVSEQKDISSRLFPLMWTGAWSDLKFSGWKRDQFSITSSVNALKVSNYSWDQSGSMGLQINSSVDCRKIIKPLMKFELWWNLDFHQCQRVLYRAVIFCKHPQSNLETGRSTKWVPQVTSIQDGRSQHQQQSSISYL